MDTRLEEYYKREELLRVLVESSHEAYISAAEAYDEHRARMTTLHCGNNTKRYLDGKEI